MSPDSATIIGSPISPYVRKVLAVCEIKGIPYRLDPIVPFFGDDRFSELSPLRRIPVFVHDDVSLCDSTVICEYLEERYPMPRVLPTGLAHRAQARWMEEFSDTRMGDVFIWDIFYEAVILPFVFQRARDKALSFKPWPPPRASTCVSATLRTRVLWSAPSLQLKGTQMAV